MSHWGRDSPKSQGVYTCGHVCLHGAAEEGCYTSDHGGQGISKHSITGLDCELVTQHCRLMFTDVREDFLGNSQLYRHGHTLLPCIYSCKMYACSRSTPKRMVL